jgi:hypothetical protein
MLDLFWDIYQQRRINEATETAEDSKRQAASANADAAGALAEVRALRRSLERMALANMAMWELVRGPLKITDQMLADKMEEIDLRDGVRDGRITPPREPGYCPKCGRRTSQRHERCIYCGEITIPRSEPFSTR